MISGPLFLCFLLVALAVAKDVGPNYLSLTDDANAWETQYGSYPFKTYRSSNITSPAVRKAVDSPLCYDDNYIFLSPRGFRVPNPAVTILDNHGHLIWSHLVKGQAYNLKVQEYKGEKVLTYWVGDDAVGGHGEGYFYVLNSKYEEIARIRGVNNLRADLHELTITPEGTALVTFYQIYPLHHPGLFRITDTVYIWDCLFQEFDIASQKLVFEWRASEHHELDESYAVVDTDGLSIDHPYDWYHINSVQKDDLGNYLVSARFTSTITYIDGRTGDIIWVLGGKRNSFSDLSNGQATNMQYQHVARFAPLTTFPSLMAKEIADHGKNPHKDGFTKQLLTLFDNGIPPRPARGLILDLTYPSQGVSTNAPLTARVVKAYEHPLHIDSVSQGSLQIVHSNLTQQSDPHILLGFGWQGTWTEHLADGTLLCDSRIVVEKGLQSPGKGYVQSYSVLKYPWKAVPHYPPVAVPAPDKTSVFVSWNGATDVYAWHLSVLINEQWQPHRKALKEGFETELELPNKDLGRDLIRYIIVEAVDENGNVLGKTEIVDLWAKGLVSRITQMAPGNGGGFISWVLLVCVVAVVVFIADRVVKSRRSGRVYQKLRKH
ncbi:hypothetical protein E4T50_14909 [Aureobasidium sp. EXF-12298]|nr:hypothetical protein E4T50_14909 [Aureobasidium sp. EXF-12298]KAI4753015.1 hypothetical protein E4T51_13829 [Aureobasidium sp. EXF-12344]KAI4770150.1 hypothetical protein E4T52_14818 [Aureobasidium sp. EXF-3400]